MSSHPRFIERRINPQISSRLGSETALTRLWVDGPVELPKCMIDHSIDRAKSCNTAGPYWKCRWPVDRPTGFLSSLSTSVNRSKSCPCQSTERSTHPSLVYVDRPSGRPKSFHIIKKLYLMFLPSLSILHLSEDFSNLSRTPMSTCRNRHTNSAKLTHDLDLSAAGKIDTRSR